MISGIDYKARRQRIFEKMLDNSVAILPAASIQYRNSDTERPFRQESHFHYVTGFDENSAIATLIKIQGRCLFVLFCQPKDPTMEQWTGVRAGLEGACKQYGADEAYAISEVSCQLLDILSRADTVYFLMNAARHFHKKLFSLMKALQKKVRSGAHRPSQLIDLQLILNEMRLVKSEEEIKKIKRACDISALAHLKAMQQTRPGLYEYDLEAILFYEFCRQGSRFCAYPSIVASGNNACTLHYTQNDCILKENELVLIDAGAEVDYYASDITRTFPISGKFTGPQQALYELVLAAQKEAINSLAPGILWSDAQDKILEILVRGLVDLKILRGNVQDLIHEKAYRPFYMHNSGHWLGLDVHDVGEYKVDNAWRPLKPGMVFTVEPGLYIDERLEDVDDKWRGIGIRIEDDIVITSNGAQILSDKVPKEIKEIEEIMQGSHQIR